MSTTEFQAQCREVFKVGNIDFPTPREFQGDYVEAFLLPNGQVKVVLSDYWATGYGATVRQAFERADNARHLELENDSDLKTT